MRAIKLLECGMHVCGLPGQTLTSCRLAKGVAGGRQTSTVKSLQGDTIEVNKTSHRGVDLA
jgi:hypothetical protein